MVATGVYRAVEPDEWEQLPYSVRNPLMRTQQPSVHGSPPLRLRLLCPPPRSLPPSLTRRPVA